MVFWGIAPGGVGAFLGELWCGDSGWWDEDLGFGGFLVGKLVFEEAGGGIFEAGDLCRFDKVGCFKHKHY